MCVACWANTAMAMNVNVTAPIIDLSYAKYQGYFDAQTNITSFLSIRYAAPPVGEYPRPLIVRTTLVMLILPPRKPEISSTSATSPRIWCTTCEQNPNMCYQTSFGASMTAPISPYGHDKRQSMTPAASEDCLFLKYVALCVLAPDQV